MKENHNTNIKLYNIEDNNIEDYNTFATTRKWKPGFFSFVPNKPKPPSKPSGSGGFSNLFDNNPAPPPTRPNAPPTTRPNASPTTRPNASDVSPTRPNTSGGPKVPDGPSPSRKGESLGDAGVKQDIKSVEATMETNPSFTERVGRRFNSAANIVRRNKIFSAIIAVAAVVGLDALIKQLDEDMCNKCCLSTNIKTQSEANTPPPEAEPDKCIKPNGWDTYFHPMPYNTSTKISLFEEGDEIVFETNSFKILRNDKELSKDIINKLLDLQDMELNKDMFYNYIVYDLSDPLNNVDELDSPIKYQIKGTITEEEANADNINLIEKDDFKARWESAIESASNEKIPVTGTYVTVGPDEIELFEIRMPIDNINRDTVMLDENNSIILKVLSPSKILPREELPDQTPEEYCSNKCKNKFKKIWDTIQRAGHVAVDVSESSVEVAAAAAEITGNTAGVAANVANAAANADFNPLEDLNPLSMFKGFGSDIKNMLIIGVVIFIILVIIKNK